MEAVRTTGVFLILSMFLPYLWTLDIDIILESGSSLECKQDICITQSSANNITWIIHPREIFAQAKIVSYIQARIAVIASFSPCAQDWNIDMSCRSWMHACPFPGNVTELYVRDLFINLKKKPSFIFGSIRQEETFLDSVARSITSISLHEKWKRYVLITSSYGDSAVIPSKLNLPLPHLLFSMDANSNMTHFMENIYKTLNEEDMRIIVLCSFDCIIRLLHQAHLLDTKHARQSRWLIFPTGGEKETLLQSHLHFKTSEVVFVEYDRCLKHYHAVRLNKLTHELRENERNLTDFVIERRIQLSATVSNKTVASIYSLDKTPTATLIKQGGCIKQDGSISGLEIFAESKYGFHNRTLTVALLKWKPFIMKEDVNGSVSYSGISVDLLIELSSSLNFSYTLIEPPDQEWGQIKDGRWTGLVGLMAYKKADLVLAPIAVEASREEVMDFTMPYFYVHSTVILNKAEPQKTMTLVAPFRYEVHICILFSLIFSTFILFVMEEVNPKNRRTQKTLCMRRMRFGDILWYHFGALMANGGAYLPNTQSGRTILSCWWLFTVISAATYSGNLIAFLTDWRDKLPFTTLSEMVQQEGYKWGTIKGSALITLFQRSNRSEYKKIWNGIEKTMKTDPDIVSADNDVHLRKVLNGGYAYIGDVSLLDVFRAEYCGLQMLNDRFFSLNYAVGLPNNSIYTDIFSNEILRISESGLLNIWYKKWMPKDRCETVKSARRVDLLTLQGLFYAAGVGVLVALVVLLIEITFKRRSKCLREDSDNNDAT